MNCIKRGCRINMRQLHIIVPIRKFISTKAVMNLLVAAIFLTFAGQARATATYDASAFLYVSFNQAIQSYMTPYDQNTSGSGSHYEIVSLSWSEPNNPYGPYPWFKVASHVEGWAGDATGTTDGTSEASLTTKFILNFLFPENDATTLTLTKFGSNVQANTAAPLLNESAGASASINMLLDGNSIWFGTDNTYTANLTGNHSITLIASAAGSASASYQPVPAPEPSTMLLLGLGLMGLAGVRRKFKK